MILKSLLLLLAVGTIASATGRTRSEPLSSRGPPFLVDQVAAPTTPSEIRVCDATESICIDASWHYVYANGQSSIPIAEFTVCRVDSSCLDTDRWVAIAFSRKPDLYADVVVGYLAVENGRAVVENKHVVVGERPVLDSNQSSLIDFDVEHNGTNRLCMTFRRSPSGSGDSLEDVDFSKSGSLYVTLSTGCLNVTEIGEILFKEEKRWTFNTLTSELDECQWPALRDKFIDESELWISFVTSTSLCSHLNSNVRQPMVNLSDSFIDQWIGLRENYLFNLQLYLECLATLTDGIIGPIPHLSGTPNEQWETLYSFAIQVPTLTFSSIY